jgi:hypothetical protein
MPTPSAVPGSIDVHYREIPHSYQHQLVRPPPGRRNENDRGRQFAVIAIFGLGLLFAIGGVITRVRDRGRRFLLKRTERSEGVYIVVCPPWPLILQQVIAVGSLTRPCSRPSSLRSNVLVRPILLRRSLGSEFSAQCRRR